MKLNSNSTKAVAFNDLLETIKDEIAADKESEMFHWSAQTDHLSETCNTNVEVDWITFTFNAHYSLGQRSYQQFYMVLAVELESAIKAKKRVVKQIDTTFDSSDIDVNEDECDAKDKNADEEY